MSVRDTSGKAIANLEYEHIRHLGPVFHGDTIYAESEIMEVRESRSRPDRGIVYMESRGYNQRKEQILTLRRRFLVPKRRASGAWECERSSRPTQSPSSTTSACTGRDIAGSIAHARMLARQEIIAAGEAEAIVRGLEEIEREIESGEFPWRPGLEDIHMNIERRLFERIGETAGRLHTARSRNDQVALDVRMYARERCAEVLGLLRDLRGALVDLASANSGVILRATPTCRGRSRSSSPTTCSPTSRCSAETPGASPRHWRAPT